MTQIKPPQPPPTPQEMFERAKKVILYQDDVLRTLSLQLYYHLKLRYLYQQLVYKAVEEGQEPKAFWAQADSDVLPPAISKAPIFITGPTGSGKTHVIKQLCQMFGLNFLSVNSNQISNSGYKGTTLADLGGILVNKARPLTDERPYFADMEAQFSVIFFDEFDKLFLNTEGANLGVYQQALVNELLTIFEGTSEFPVKEDRSIASHHMLFILGGSFNLHQKSVKPTIGFTGENKPVDIPTDQLTLGKLGLPDELAGRIGQILTMKELDDQMLKDILLNSPTSPIATFKNRLAMEHCTLEVADDLLEALLSQQQSAIDKFGVRGLYQGFNELPQVQDVLLDAVGSPHHHYLLDLVGFSKEYREPVIEQIDEPSFEVELVNPSELPDWFTGKKPDKPQSRPIDDDYDDMPF